MAATRKDRHRDRIFHGEPPAPLRTANGRRIRFDPDPDAALFSQASMRVRMAIAWERLFGGGFHGVVIALASFWLIVSASLGLMSLLGIPIP